MSRKAGIIFMMIGAVLMLSALFLALYNAYEEYRVNQKTEILLTDIRSVMEERTEFLEEIAENDNEIMESNTKNDSESETNPSEGTLSEDEFSAGNLTSELPVEIIDGYGYIGYISIPQLKLELPVMSEWDYKRLKIAPCRHFGSSRTDDLVIAAHNYKAHFKSLSNLKIGSEICFTDMDGMENYYTLVKLETLAPDAVEVVQNSGYDLVLYTCTPGGAARVVAFCDRKSDKN